MATGYPVGLSVDYPERKLNRLTTFFRIFVAIPILIILGLLMGRQLSSCPSKDGASICSRHRAGRSSAGADDTLQEEVPEVVV